MKHGDETMPSPGSEVPSYPIRAATLRVVSGPDAGRTARVEVPRFSIGTGAAADLKLTDPMVSREHLTLRLSQTGVTLIDAASKNGTWLGDVRVHHVVIASDVQLRVGANVLMVRVDEAQTQLPMSRSTAFGAAIGHSPAMRSVFLTLERAAPSELTILMEGESGTGKEVLAHAIHEHSSVAQGPFVAVDCGAIAPNLIESELFGHERGAFTGADDSRKGLVEEANGGTLFLDEIGELPLELQSRLLRVLEAREVRAVGSSQPTRVKVRVVAATNRRLAQAVADGEFRQDLYFRLSVVNVHIPPLRERREDILPIARELLRRASHAVETDFPPDVARVLESHSWPGNARELRNAVERYVHLGARAVGSLFERAVVGGGGSTGLLELPYAEARQRFDDAYIEAALAKWNGVIARAAEASAIPRPTFYRMLQRARPKGEVD